MRGRLSALGGLAVLACSIGLGCSKGEATSTTTITAARPEATGVGIAPAAPPPVVAVAAPASAVKRTLAGKKVLHVGDSMVGGTFGLTRALEARLSAEGAKMVRHTQVSASLVSFDKSPTLKDLLRTHDPDIVIINLGANDELSPYPAGYAHHVSNIARRVGADRECWWIGPPSWKGPDAGLVKVIRENTGTCRFFDSTKLDLERASDGVHPNDRGAAKWAEAFWVDFNAPQSIASSTSLVPAP